MENQSEAYQSHLINILSDSNLPVGGFVSSSGLESFIAHSFLSTASSDVERSDRLIGFLHSSLLNYASLALPFMIGLFSVLGGRPETVVGSTLRLDDLYHAMCLNLVARRCSLAQGAAMVMLYQKAFSSADQTVMNLLKIQLRTHKRTLHFPIAYALTTGLLGLSCGVCS